MTSLKDEILFVSVLVLLGLGITIFGMRSESCPATPCQATCQQEGFVQGSATRKDPNMCRCQGTMPATQTIRLVPLRVSFPQEVPDDEADRP